MISELLRRHHGNRAAAAREFGVHPSTLFRKIKTLGIHLPRYRARSERP